MGGRWLVIYGLRFTAEIKMFEKTLSLTIKIVVVGFFVLTFAKSEDFLVCDGTINYAKTLFYQKPAEN